MTTNKIILCGLTAALKGQILPEDYRAVLIPDGGKLGPVIRVEQPIDGQWHPTGGGWYLSTLAERMHSSRDGISIDYGQRWSIVEGMNAAIVLAMLYVEQEADNAQ